MNKIPRLSEAIRLGSLLKPQAYGYYFDDVGSCALGAAADANGIDLINVQYDDWETEVYEFLERIYPWITTLQVQYPHKVGVWEVMSRIIPDLNDKYGWTRERIADWVAENEPVEPAEQNPTVLPTAEAVEQAVL